MKKALYAIAALFAAGGLFGFCMRSGEDDNGLPCLCVAAVVGGVATLLPPDPTGGSGSSGSGHGGAGYDGGGRGDGGFGGDGGGDGGE
ncbi:hypothetical protein AB0I28_35880 [Phytomonospora sp. NPDC050363]|uniref:hypothetical protein n=1 Tax=Phytomonospora sp. NPDC050363 TaxID=3155642 RepID=UPI0033F24337